MNNKFINIKEKIMKKVLVGIIAVVATVNVFFNLYNRNEIIGLSSLKIEALAFDESHGSNLGPLYQYGCTIIEKTIMGYDSDGNPVIQEVPYPGESGYCAGSIGDCTPYDCTRYY